MGAPYFAHLLPRSPQWHSFEDTLFFRASFSPSRQETRFPNAGGDVLDILGVLNARENRYNLIHGVLTGLEKWCLGVFTDWEKMCFTICERYLFSFKGVASIFLVCYQFQKNNSWFVNSSWAREKYLPFKGVTSTFLCYQFQKNILDMLIALELVRNIFLLKVWPRYSWCVNSSTVGRLVPRPRS